ncbi:prepilin peptidase [Roseomonas eburnea]|uniref:Prepilin peptidase n=1 Tax=Neoroseomonas eburnea TaxID=1346889 RepID=A0A9X9XA79_9PROT|nr:prepilin peptidase [Neoroseomonas eburnea]MBR0680615.1 prepilin peptidase [Neoroseomonas eburnea]
MSGLLLFQVVAIPLLVFAAARDVATRLIPDTVSIVIALAGLAARLSQGWSEAGYSVLIGAGLFVALLPLAARGMLGGGDVKLMSAMAVGLAPFDTWHFIVVTVFAGGVLGIAYILGRFLVPQPRVAGGGTLLRRVLAVEAWRVRRRGPLPYAVAIAVGGILVLLSLPRA